MVLGHAGDDSVAEFRPEEVQHFTRAVHTGSILLEPVLFLEELPRTTVSSISKYVTAVTDPLN